MTGEKSAILISKDYHSVWLNSAALAAAGGDLDVEGGVVERDEHGEPTGVLREESAWRFRDRYVLTTQDEWVEATREGVRLANSRGVGAIHDKDGWLGAPGIFQRLREEGNLSLRVWGSIPHESVGHAHELALRSGFGDEYLRIGYLKCFMDGTLGSQTARLTDGSGVEITSGAELEEIVRRGAEAGWPVAVHAIGDQANRDALDAFEATREAWEYFKRAAAIDLANNLGNAAGGVHIGALGGLWQATVLGMAGMRLRDNGLAFDPHVPKGWQRLSFSVQWRRRQLSVIVGQNPVCMELHLAGEVPMEIEITDGPRVMIHPGDCLKSSYESGQWQAWRSVQSHSST